jgi:hypothetical protein
MFVRKRLIELSKKYNSPIDKDIIKQLSKKIFLTNSYLLRLYLYKKCKNRFISKIIKEYESFENYYFTHKKIIDTEIKRA